MLPIRGVQKLSLVDYPGHLCSVVFVSGCNLRCGYCHNPSLVHPDPAQPCIPEDEVFSLLLARKQYVEGVCITGGEPLLYPEIIAFLQRLKSAGFLVKLDTNGFHPELLKRILDAVDYVAVDVKTSLAKYVELTGATALQKFKDSVGLLMHSGVEYEFRTTAVPEFFSKDDAEQISNLIRGAKHYYIQQFSNRGPLLNPQFELKEPYPREHLERMKRFMEAFVQRVEVRG